MEKNIFFTHVVKSSSKPNLLTAEIFFPNFFSPIDYFDERRNFQEKVTPKYEIRHDSRVLIVEPTRLS